MSNAWLLVGGAAVIAVAVAVATSGGDSPAVATSSAVGTPPDDLAQDKRARRIRTGPVDSLLAV